MSAGRARAGKGRRRGARPGRLASRASSAVSTPHLQRAPGSGDCCAPAGHARPPHRAGAEVRRLAACMPASHVAAPQLMYGVWFHSPHRHVMPASAFRSLIVLSGAPEDGAMDLQRLGEVGAAPGQPVQAVSRAVAAAAGRAAAVRWRPPAAPPRLRADRACCVCAPAATSSCPTLAHGSSSCALCKQAGAVLPPASAAHLASCTGGCQLRLAASVRPFMQSPLRRQVRRVQAGGRRSAPARGPGRGLFPDPAVCPRAGRGPVRAAPGQPAHSSAGSSSGASTQSAGCLRSAVRHPTLENPLMKVQWNTENNLSECILTVCECARHRFVILSEIMRSCCKS